MKKNIFLNFFVWTITAAFCQQEGINYVGNPSPSIIHAIEQPRVGWYDFDCNQTDDFWIGVVNYRFYHVECFTLGSWQFYHSLDVSSDTISTLPETKWKDAPDNPWSRERDITDPRIYIMEGESVDSIIVAVRQPVNGSFCYGWLRFSVIGDGPSSTPPNNTTCIIHDYAFCNIPGYPLRAGQTNLTWGVDENNSNVFATVHPNPTSKIITITGESLKSAIVANIFGQRVAEANGEGNTLRIDLTALPAGIYFVAITDNEGRKCAQKVVKE